VRTPPAALALRPKVEGPTETTVLRVSEGRKVPMPARDDTNKESDSEQPGCLTMVRRFPNATRDETGQFATSRKLNPVRMVR
jgi:hypothetical protein